MRKSATDLPTIQLGNDDRGRARTLASTVARIGWPLALIFGWVVHICHFGVFTRVLNVHKHGFAVWRFAPAGDFSTFRTHQKAFESCFSWRFANVSVHGFVTSIAAFVCQSLLSAVAHMARYSRHQHAVGHIGVSAIVCLNPANAGSLAEHQTVW